MSFNKSDGTLRIGFAGYMTEDFSEVTARKIIVATFATYDRYSAIGPTEVVTSNLAIGIPLLVHQEAMKRGFRTVGIVGALTNLEGHHYRTLEVEETIPCSSPQSFVEAFGDRVHVAVCIGETPEVRSLVNWITSRSGGDGRVQLHRLRAL